MLTSPIFSSSEQLQPTELKFPKRRGRVLAFIERFVGVTIPRRHAVWLQKHVAPEQALIGALPFDLLWLAGRVYADVSGPTKKAVLRAATIARLAYDNQYKAPFDAVADARGAETTELLRTTLEATAWWTRLRHRWDFEQTRGIGTVSYTIGRGPGATWVRGTRVGHFAVREVAVPFERGELPPLRHCSRTPRHWGNAHGPEHVYAIDVVASGLSVGAYTSPAIAFEIAHRFEGAGVFSGPIPKALRRLLRPYQGAPPPISNASWPASPPTNFVERVPMQPIAEEVHRAVG